MNDHAPYAEMAAGYALDALDTGDQADFVTHLDDCEQCREDVRRFSEVAAGLAAGAAVEPPEDVEASLLRTVGRHSTHQPQDRRFGHWRWLGAAAAAVLVLMAVLLAWPTPDPVTTAAQSQAMEVMSAPDAHVMALSLPAGTSEIAVSMEMDKAAIMGDGVRAPGAGTAYQVWRVTSSGRIVSAGMVTPDAQGHVAQPLHGGARTAEGYMVTIEPTSGSAQPTTPPIAEVHMT